MKYIWRAIWEKQFTDSEAGQVRTANFQIEGCVATEKQSLRQVEDEITKTVSPQETLLRIIYVESVGTAPNL